MGRKREPRGTAEVFPAARAVGAQGKGQPLTMAKSSGAGEAGVGGGTSDTIVSSRACMSPLGRRRQRTRC